MMDYNITCDEDSNKTCDEDSNKTCKEDLNTTCDEDLFCAGGTAVKEDGGEKWTSFCPDQDAGAEGGERHTGNKLWRFS